MTKKKQGARAGSTGSDVDLEGKSMDIRSILKDIEFLGSSHMTWKEKKDLENKKVVSLGGKPPKKQRLPLSVARLRMKKEKEKEQKMLEESSILGRFEMFGGNKRKAGNKRKPEDKVLKSTAGNFRNGVLDVKHLLQTSASRDSDSSNRTAYKGKKKKAGKKSAGKKKNGGRRQH